MYRVKVSAKGPVTLPKTSRDKHAINPGSEIRIVEVGDVLVLVPVPCDPVTALRGLLKQGPSLPADLFQERARKRIEDAANDA